MNWIEAALAVGRGSGAGVTDRFTPDNALRQARQTRHVSPLNSSARRVVGGGMFNHRMQQPGGSNMGRLNDFAQRFRGQQMQGGGGIRQAFVNHGQRQNIDMGQLRQTLLQRGQNSPISSAAGMRYGGNNGLNAIRMARDMGGGFGNGSIAGMGRSFHGGQLQPSSRMAQRAGLQGFTMPTNIRYLGG